MIKILKQFPKNLKNYLDHIVTVSFGELIVYLIEILILIAIPLLLVSFGVSLVKDMIYYILLAFIDGSELFFSIYDAIFAIIVSLLVFISFVYFFNRRYESFKKEIKETKSSKTIKKVKYEEEELELPKVK